MRYGMIFWMKAIRKKPEMRKITVILPRELVETATRVSKLNLTATIRQGLEAVAATDAYEQLRKLRGKERFSISLKELRRD
jgi:post-segregation antitoxin (ccd killing protein)